MKIGICTPVEKLIPRGYTGGLVKCLSRWQPLYDISVWHDPNIPVDRARNGLVEAAKLNECDYIFFWDSDVTIEPDTLPQLLSRNVDIVSGMVFEKQFPYALIAKRKVAPKLYSALDLPLDGQIHEVDGIGLGCCLIKREVFEKLPFPWFRFEYYEKFGKWLQLSEDLYFSQNALDAGYKLYIDTSIQTGHFGTIVTADDYQMHKKWRDLSINMRDNVVKEVSEWTKDPLEDVYYKFHAGVLIAADEWKKHGLEMYSKSMDYIYDLAAWHISERFPFDLQLVSAVNKMPTVKTVLDFGCGIGQNALMLAASNKQLHVCMADFDGPVFKFAKWRAKQRKIHIESFTMDQLRITERKFDLVLVFDVLEHVPDEEFANVIAMLKRISKKIILSVTFGKTVSHPMHYDASEEKWKLIQTLPVVQMTLGQTS